MKSAEAEPTGSSNRSPVPLCQTGTGRFMVTLCELAAPVSLRPPQSPQLKPFTFFMSGARQPDGSERLYLHMGYFETLAEAERRAESARRRYPRAFATIAPRAPLWSAGSETPSLSRSAHPAVSQSSHHAPIKNDSLTDTQVLGILETRRSSAVPDDVDGRDHDRIELLRPEDTIVRKALKEAVVRGASVSFAVQLHWSTQPIDLNRVRSLDAFKGLTLYATGSRRNGRSSYFLRLGFFSDPALAKQLAAQVRSTFVSAAVIPVVEPEITRAREGAVSSSGIPNLVEQLPDQESDSEFHDTQGSPTQSRPSRRVSEGAERVDRTRDPRSGREIRTEPDPLSDSGVRHLKVMMQEPLSGRWKVVKLREAAAEYDHIGS